MIQRRILGVSTGLALLAAHCNGRTQPGAAMRRVGVLMPGSQASSAGVIAAFKHGMADGGWLEGKNIDYRIGYANGDLGRFDALAIELPSKFDLIINLKAAKGFGLTIPQSLLLRADEVIQ